jgi:tetratricopeptide (TPR) repeat protein
MKLRSSPLSLCCLRLVLPLLLLISSWSARADNTPPNITAGEIALLPEYCKDVQGFGYGDAYHNTSPRAGYWVGLMGKSFWALHHQCWALIREHRSRAAGLSRQDRDAHIQGAVGDYGYVVANSEKDFILLPEIFTQMGEAHVLLGNIGAALDAFTAARRRKTDYWPPYVAWARVLMKSGKRQEALNHVEYVMKLAPTDVELKRQYDLLKNGPVATNRATNRNLPRASVGVSAATRSTVVARPASTPEGAAGARPIPASAVSR